MYEFLDKRYAQALYDVAKSKGRVDKYIADLEDIVKTIETNPEFKDLIKHPEISTQEKKKTFINIFKGKIDEDLLTFMLILVEKDRILFIREKLEELKKIDLENRETIIAKVTTVQPLKEHQRASLKETLSRKHHKNVILNEVVDPEILGGLIIRVGDALIDASVRNTLDEMKNQMATSTERIL